MATNDPLGSGAADDRESVGTPDPGGGGCLKFGWGCLPVLAAVLTLPLPLLF